MLKAIWVLFKANAKLQLKSPSIFVLSTLTPIAYPIIFVLQIVIAYHINANAFYRLPQGFYVTGMFAVQVLFWLSMDRSMRYLTYDILTADLDLILTRPINLFFYKYFRRLDLMSVVMTLFSYAAFVTSSIVNGLTMYFICKATIFIILSSLLYLNLKSIFYGWTFFARDARQLSKVHQALEDLVWNKPQDIFPGSIKFILTYIVPYIIVASFIFDLIRSKDTRIFWSITIGWTIFAMIGNHTLWKVGLRKYESIG